MLNGSRISGVDGQMFGKSRHRNFLFILFAALGFLSSTASARDTEVRFSIDSAMQTSTARSFTGVQFFFGDETHPEVMDRLGTYESRRTTNAFAKSDLESCQWAFLSGIKSLYQRALSEGGNAVINIQSITTGQRISSQTEFVCRAGNVVSKVYLEGDVVRLNSSNNTNSSNVHAAGSPDVKDAQTILNSLGLDAGPADGVMGPKTEVAVKNFQKISGLPVSGLLDEGTLEALHAVQSGNN